MVCFVLIQKNNMNKKYLAEILTKLVKQKYISKVAVHYVFFVKTAFCCLCFNNLNWCSANYYNKSTASYINIDALKHEKKKLVT